MRPRSLLAIISAALLLALPLVAGAETATLSFTRPTTYTDGSPLPAAAITGYEFRCGAGTSAGVTCPTLTLGGTATGGSMTLTGPASGFTACFEGRTLVAAGPGPYSAPPVCRSFPPLQPSPPGAITVAVVIGVNVAPAYTITTSGARSSAVAGFVDLGRPCIGSPVFTYRGKSYRRVASTDVRWWNTTPTANVAAPCA
jgi:hypothetical protein